MTYAITAWYSRERSSLSNLIIALRSRIFTAMFELLRPVRVCAAQHRGGRPRWEPQFADSGNPAWSDHRLDEDRRRSCRLLICRQACCSTQSLPTMVALMKGNFRWQASLFGD